MHNAAAFTGALSESTTNSIPQPVTWVVLKFGGTSVAGRPQWDQIAALAQQRRQQGFHVLLVCSAVAGVTNRLQALADSPSPDSAAIDDLLARHQSLARELEIPVDDLLAEARSELHAGLDQEPGPRRAACLLALGEWLSTRLGARFLARSMEASWADARDLLTAITEHNATLPRAWLSARCAVGADPQGASRWSALAPVLVCPGFVAANARGETVLLGRGGSDTSAALLAGRLGAHRVEIWTDVPGLFSADPRQLPGARLIPELSYAEALEMAAGGARVIHGQAIRAAAEAGIPLSIHDLAQPAAANTVVTAQAGGGEQGIRAVTCQPHMLVLLLENLDTRQQVGFLAGVFATVAEQGVSVDLVATSETTTTLAIHRVANHLDEARLALLVNALQALCRVTAFPDCSCINLVGRCARRALAGLAVLEDFLAERPLLMTSQSANDLGISLLVHAADAGRLVQILHRALVERL
jgi:diaminopimelate decarboxylase/aspartate kinase